MSWRLPWGIVLFVAAAGCGGSSPSQNPQPAPDTGDSITGRERLGWDQLAADAAEARSLRFAIYVDGIRFILTDTTCADTAGPAGFFCSGTLPPMNPGVHTLELAAFVPETPVVEGPRSSPFRVTVRAAASGSTGPATWASGEAGVTGDGVTLHVERLLDGFERPSDAAFAPDGRLFVAERGGRIRIVRDRQLQELPALELDNLFQDGGLLAIALDPDFARSRYVFTLSTASSRSGPVFRLARYRELLGVLAQRAVLLETPADVPAAAMRFGADGMLYIALGRGGQASPASYGGKILRLRPDGRAPADRRAGMPAISDGHVAPRALAWRPGGDLLWISDGASDGVEWIAGIRLDEAAVSTRPWALPPSEITSGMTFYDSERIPEFRGDLLIASAAAQRILRVKFGADPLAAEFSEVLLAHRVGPIRVVLTGPDGAIYFCTDAALGRLVPITNH